MATLFYLLGALSWLGCLFLFAIAAGAVHEASALILFLAGCVCFVGAACLNRMTTLLHALRRVENNTAPPLGE